MDSNRSKRRSFKLLKSLYRATKSSSAAAPPPYTTKQPKPIASNNSSHTSIEFVANQPIKPKAPPTAGSPLGLIIVNQEQVTPKVAFVVTDRTRDSYGKLENFYGGGGGGAAVEDEAVDVKAAKYISSVRERFQLERVNSERKNFEDINLY